jgi:hypothetical protein
MIEKNVRVSNMQMRFMQWSGLLALAAASSLIAPAAIAQTQELSGFEPIRIETLPEAFERAFFEHSGNFYRNRLVGSQIEFIIGPYPENQIARDGLLVNLIYQDALEQQVSSDPVLRTPDLVNPYNDTSLRINPSLRVGFPPTVEGSEFNFQTFPSR